MKFAAFAIVTVALLAGCTPVASPTATPTPASSSTAEPSALPTDDAPDPTDPSTWVIESAAVGPIALGDAAADAADALTSYGRGEALGDCPVIFLDAPGLPGVVLSPGSDGAIEAITITSKSAGMPQDPTVLADASPRTSEGVGIGSTRDELVAALPDAEIVRDDPASVVYRTGSASPYRLFVVESDRVVAITVSYADAIPREFC
ncbi:hypothetical protein M2152_000557 [Microbacteriaceae bacterium SG_E_30_P1]|uniref:Peptidase inhibitor I78 family protein n=1 Tax=Antiquaquibacter oligotrophicus TaxID=2880260 RepID=A0ABT6KK47_9MICO|nr:hypothetical protein [Antiquaquibacter oligotrophicus]MDH6180375.1 hypothetical protein [Antiquaquibacter oligotrophicus]UDF13883.1 hypothetical protein LH407_03230 [Antiquaquibacter oligotrophicus]